MKLVDIIKKENVFIHTKTKNQANRLMKELDKQELEWADGRKYNHHNNHWKLYKANTCYCPHDCYIRNFGSLDADGFTIVEFKDVEFMDKKDRVKKAEIILTIYIALMITFYLVILSLGNSHIFNKTTHQYYDSENQIVSVESVYVKDKITYFIGDDDYIELSNYLLVVINNDELDGYEYHYVPQKDVKYYTYHLGASEPNIIYILDISTHKAILGDGYHYSYAMQVISNLDY